MSTSSLLQDRVRSLASLSPYRTLGRVQRVRGLVMEAQGPQVTIGELCAVSAGARQCLAEVVGFSGHVTLLMPLEDIHGLGPVTGRQRPGLGRRVGLPIAPRGIAGVEEPHLRNATSGVRCRECERHGC